MHELNAHICYRPGCNIETYFVDRVIGRLQTWTRGKLLIKFLVLWIECVCSSQIFYAAAQLTSVSTSYPLSAASWEPQENIPNHFVHEFLKAAQKEGHILSAPDILLQEAETGAGEWKRVWKQED